MTRLALTLTLSLLTLVGCQDSGGGGGAPAPPADPIPPVVPAVVPAVVDYWPSLNQADAFALTSDLPWIRDLTATREVGSDGWTFDVDWLSLYWQTVLYYHATEAVQWDRTSPPFGDKQVSLSQVVRSLELNYPAYETVEWNRYIYDLKNPGVPLILLADSTDLKVGDVTSDAKVFTVTHHELISVEGNVTRDEEYGEGDEGWTATTTVLEQLDVTANGVTYPGCFVINVVITDSETGGWRSDTIYYLAPGIGVVRQVGFTPFTDLYWNVSRDEITFDRVAP